MKTKDLHRHKCTITEKGMSEGFLFCDDTLIKNEEDALKYAQKNGYNTLQESYDDEFHFWTTWEDVEDLEYEGEAYDDAGNFYRFVEGNWVKVIDDEILDNCDLIGGDGLSYETYFNKETNEEYTVPIEIVRDLVNITVRKLY